MNHLDAISINMEGGAMITKELVDIYSKYEEVQVVGGGLVHGLFSLVTSVCSFQKLC